MLRVCAELALVGIIRDGTKRSGGEWIMKALKELVSAAYIVLSSSVFFYGNIALEQLSNDPSLSSLPLLSIFLKSYARPFLGIAPLAVKQQIPESSEPGTLAPAASEEPNFTAAFPQLGTKEEDELVEKDIRDRFKRMCEGYFDSVSKKLVIEHKVRHFGFKCGFDC